MRTHGLILRHGALRDVVNHRGEVVGFNLNTNVPQGRRRREIHDADKSRLLAQTHGRPVPAATRQELAPRGIPDPLGPNLLSKPIEAVREPDDPIHGRFDPQIREQVPNCAGHSLETLRRTAGRLDANAEHAPDSPRGL